MNFSLTHRILAGVAEEVVAHRPAHEGDLAAAKTRKVKLGLPVAAREVAKAWTTRSASAAKAKATPRHDLRSARPQWGYASVSPSTCWNSYGQLILRQNPVRVGPQADLAQMLLL